MKASILTLLMTVQKVIGYGLGSSGHTILHTHTHTHTTHTHTHTDKQTNNSEFKFTLTELN